MPKLSRRNFLGKTGAGLFGLAAYVWIPKRVFAAPPPVGRRRRLFILHAAGGMRSTALFNAHVVPQWNPFGAFSTVDMDAGPTPEKLLATAEWGAGKVLVPADRKPVVLAKWANAKLPFITQIADRISVLASVDHDPAAGLGDGNHYSAIRRMCTGAPDGQNGLLTIISKELDGKTPLPPTIIGGAGPLGAGVYGSGAGLFSRFRPLYLNGPTDFRTPAAGVAAQDPEYVKTLEGKLDQGLAGVRPRALEGRLSDFPIVKQLGQKFGSVLRSEALRVSYVAAAALGMTTDGRPLTNEMLAEPFATAGLPAALGVRLLQLGAPAVAVNFTGWDLHSEEQNRLPALAASFGRTLAALHFVLSRLADPEVPGKTFWDTTLIVCASEFGRDNTSATVDGGLTIGFNRGNGSDHHGTNACRYQALPIMGGGIAGGRLVRPTTDKVQPTRIPIGTNNLLATLLSALEIDPRGYFTMPPIPETEIYA